MANPPQQSQSDEQLPLNHALIAQALMSSTDGGQTLDFSHFKIAQITDEAAQELAKIGREEDDDEGAVTRCVVSWTGAHGSMESALLTKRDA